MLGVGGYVFQSESLDHFPSPRNASHGTSRLTCSFLVRVPLFPIIHHATQQTPSVTETSNSACHSIRESTFLLRCFEMSRTCLKNGQSQCLRALVAAEPGSDRAIEIGCLRFDRRVKAHSLSSQPSQLEVVPVDTLTCPSKDGMSTDVSIKVLFGIVGDCFYCND